jgi:hypothetical protein
MAKVYYDKEKNNWFIDSLEDYYMFKAINSETNEESEMILSWSRNIEITEEEQNIGIVRIYDVEIDSIKYYFTFKIEKESIYNVSQREIYSLENLLRDKNLFFTGEVKIVE